jgi:hypothetical protein
MAGCPDHRGSGASETFIEADGRPCIGVMFLERLKPYTAASEDFRLEH